MNEEKKREFLEKRKIYQDERKILENEILIADNKAIYWQNEAQRIDDVLDNSEQIIRELANEFKKGTTLNSSDMTFLFFATAIQCGRWLLQPKVNTNFQKISKSERHSAGKDGYLEFSKGKEIASNNVSGNIKSRKYPDKEKMFLLAVPYDAMEGTEKIAIAGVTELGKNISGTNHHAATMGHDPVLGYIFGTINILSRTITFKTPSLSTNLVHLHQGSNRKQYVGKSIGFVNALERARESAEEDITRIPAAVTRQALHMQSDKYTKAGLPIPFIAPDKAQMLLQQGWNSYELERFIKFLGQNTATISVQAMTSMLINIAIETLYKLTYNENVDVSKELFEVKSRKILLYSNILSSSSNLIFTALSRNINNMDIGGMLVTIYRIATDRKVMNQIREEFVYGGYEKMLQRKAYEE